MLARTMNPFAALHELQREMNRLFDGYGPRLDGGRWMRPTTFPALNVWEDGDSLHAEAEIPGVSQNEIEVYAVGNELTIKGTRRPREGEGVAYHRRERGTGEFTRVVTLPVDVNPEKVRASLKDGVLTVMLPKAEEAKPRKVTVKAS
jgi:HSP20 family protein